MEISTKQYTIILVSHLLFILGGISSLYIPLQTGVIFLSLVILYNTAVPVLTTFYQLDDLRDIWLFSFLLSILQIIPDWILSAFLEVLVFPEDGLFKIGTVAGYMWGLWTIPFFLIITTTSYVRSIKPGKLYEGSTAAGSALVIFGSSEIFSKQLGSWYAVNVSTTFHIAHYIILPEILLGIAVYTGYCLTRNWRWLERYLVIITIMILYVGLVITSYFFVEFLL